MSTTTRITLPRMDRAEVGSSYTDYVEVTVSTNEPRVLKEFLAGIRQIAQDLDPQDFDEELRMARVGVEQVGMLKHAIEAVLRFYDAGDRGTALHEAVRYLKQTVIDVDVL